MFTVDTCPALYLQNGQVTYNRQSINGGRYNRNTVATYTCDIGFDLSGLDSNTCQSSGNWQRDNPVYVLGRKASTHKSIDLKEHTLLFNSFYLNYKQT